MSDLLEIKSVVMTGRLASSVVTQAGESASTLHAAEPTMHGSETPYNRREGGPSIFHARKPYSASSYSTLPGSMSDVR
jgi:hypothetical protein